VLRKYIEHRPELLNILTNIGWLFADKFVRMAVGLLVGVWVARYLGPEQFGMINYAISFVALFGTFAALGLKNIVVRDLVREPGKSNATLGTVFLLQLMGALFAFALLTLAISYFRPDDIELGALVAVFGFALVFKSTESVKYWFESQVQSKYTVWVDNGAFLIIALVKVLLILNGASLIHFAFAALAESALLAIGLLIMYQWRGGHILMWQVRFNRMQTLLRDSWPLMLSGFTIMIYMRIDQIMIGQMLGNEAVGLYSAAIGISELWYFIPMIVASSMFPSIIKARKQSEALYYQRFQKLFNIMVLMTLAIAIPITFMSEWLIVLLYGEAYAESSTVLSIHIWAGVFVSLGVVSGNWYVLENLQMHAFYRTALGAVVSVLANLILIPGYGIIGAAIGTALAQVFASYLYDVLNVKTRRIQILKTRSLLFPYKFT